jgi:cellulose synthase operon protein C
LALALLVTIMMPAAAALAQESAEQVLLDKANYWRLKDRPDLVAQALNQLLEIDSNNPDALFLFGELSVQQNKPADAQHYLEKLQQAAPNSPHIADLQAEIRTGKIGPTDLNEARRLVQAGQLQEAVQKYREIFKGPPPSAYGVEYYMTLAGTPDGWDEARQGLEKLSQSSPNDPQLKLALAELYTYREQTRMQGIGILAELSKNPAVGADAVKSWKQALTWLGGSPAAKPALQQYLAQFPQDADVQQLLADFKNQPAGAYTNLTPGNIAATEREASADLRKNPNDPSALAELGLIRLRQQRFAESRDLLGRAIRAAPDQREALSAAYDTAAFWARVDEAKRAAAAKNYAAARAILTPLLARPHAGQWGALLVLGDVELKMNDAAAAEATYREALRARPGNPDATIGLAAALQAQNKTAEFNQLTSRMSPAERARLAGTGGGAAEKLRNEAKDASANGDIAGATAKFKAAIAADPSSPWIRLDYARFLAGQGDANGAFAAVDPATTGNTPTSILVSAMFDSQQDRWIQALDKINSIPEAQRTQEIKNFRDRIYVRGTIDKAKALAKAGRTDEARQMLVNLYNDPSVHTDEKREAPFVINNVLHDPQTALRITKDVYARGGPDSVGAGADYAMLLMIAGHHDDEAAEVIARLDASGLITESNRETVTPVRIYLAVARAEKLRTKHNYADAWDQISRLLRDNPDDTRLLIEAGSIYAASGRDKEALDYFDKAYQQDSDNIEVIRGVIGGCLLAHDTHQAQIYLDKGMEADPNNPWLYFLKAQIEIQRGNNGAAIVALKTARTLNQQQNGGAAAGGSEPTSLAPGEAPAPVDALPPNPFRRSELTTSHRGARVAAGGDSRVARQMSLLREVPV